MAMTGYIMYTCTYQKAVDCLSRDGTDMRKHAQRCAQHENFQTHRVRYFKA